MRIGRLEFGKASGQSHWGFSKGSCECLMVDIGQFYLVILDKNCKCSACKEYVCKCEDECPDCGEPGNDCCCEVW